MKIPFLFTAIGAPAAGTLHAQTPMSPRSGATTCDFVAEFSYAGRSDIQEGSRRLGEISTTQALATAVMALPFDASNTFLVGVGAQQLEFRPPVASLVPARLGSLALKLGWNGTLNAQWSLRAEADPGNYGAGSFGARDLRGEPRTPVRLRRELRLAQQSPACRRRRRALAVCAPVDTLVSFSRATRRVGDHEGFFAFRRSEPARWHI